MLLINAEEVRRALPMNEAVSAMKRALAALSAGSVQLPLRTHIDLPQHDGTTLIMPAFVSDQQGESLAVKIVSVFKRNPDRGLARIQAAVNVFDPETGQPIAWIEGSSLTGIRTAAASGAATDVLARADASRLAILGAGVQAATHVQAICAVRNIRRIKIFAPNRAKVDALIQQTSPPPCEMMAAPNPQQAVEDADIICTVTTSATPVFDDVFLKPGAHINAVGSYQPHVVEIPPETILRSRVFVDHRGSALEEAGDLIQPIRHGAITERHVLGEVGQVLRGEIEGRRNESEITLFKSVGNAAEDAVAAQVVVAAAQRLGLGQHVEF